VRSVPQSNANSLTSYEETPGDVVVMVDRKRDIGLFPPRFIIKSGFFALGLSTTASIFKLELLLNKY
jgi:hypothetical protein